MFNFEKAIDIGLRIPACQIVNALIQSSPKTASYFEPSELDAFQSLYSLAVSSFFASHKSTIKIIKHFQNNISVRINNSKKNWEEKGKLEINVKFFLFNYFIKNKHTNNNILYPFY